MFHGLKTAIDRTSVGQRANLDLNALYERVAKEEVTDTVVLLKDLLRENKKMLLKMAEEYLRTGKPVRTLWGADMSDDRWKVSAQIHPALEAGMDAIRRMKSELGPGAGLTDDSMYDDEYMGEVRCKDGSTFQIKVDILPDGKANLWTSANVAGSYDIKLEASRIFQALTMKRVVADKVINALWEVPRLAVKAHALVPASFGTSINKGLLEEAARHLNNIPDPQFVDDDDGLMKAVRNIRAVGKDKIADALERAIEDFASAQNKFDNAVREARRDLDDAY